MTAQEFASDEERLLALVQYVQVVLFGCLCALLVPVLVLIRGQSMNLIPNSAGRTFRCSEV